MLIKVRDLKPGDTLVFDRNQHGQKVEPKKAIVIDVVPASTPCVYTVTQYSMHSRTLSDFTRDADVEFEVERTDLTPAQQHADELLALVRTIKPIPGPWADDQRRLLAKIDPPQPPTAQELAAELAKITANGEVDHQAVHALLDRARQAGML